MSRWNTRRDHIRRCDQAANLIDSAQDHILYILHDYEEGGLEPLKGMDEVYGGLDILKATLKAIRQAL